MRIVYDNIHLYLEKNKLLIENISKSNESIEKINDVKKDDIVFNPVNLEEDNKKKEDDLMFNPVNIDDDKDGVDDFDNLEEFII